MSIGSILVLVFTWAVLLIFPAWAAYRLFKRGQSKLGWVTVLTIPIGLGWAFGIYGLRRPAGEPTVLDEPCPECGEREGTAAIVTLDARTGERTPLLIGAIAALVVGLAIIVVGVALGVSTWVEGDDGIIQWDYGSKVAGAAFLLLGLSFGWSIGRYGLAYFAADRMTGTLNRCAACGHAWTKLPGAATVVGAASDDELEVAAATCIDGPEGCWGPVFDDEHGRSLCRGHTAIREHRESPATSEGT